MSTNEYTLPYASTRAEVWRVYWQEWTRRSGLWRFHLLIGLAVGFAVADRGNLSQFSSTRFAFATVATTVVSIGVGILWPQLRFKPQPRLITLTADGFTTTIGNRSGQRRWADIARVEDRDGTIVLIGQKGNAMIIPPRAFASDSERQHCLASVQQWHSAAAV
jgi:hypothetical protein